MKQTISVKLIARLLLFLSLSYTPITNNNNMFLEIGHFLDGLAAAPGCLLGDAKSCALYNKYSNIAKFLEGYPKGIIATAECGNLQAKFTALNNVCQPFIAQLSINQFAEDLISLNQPLIDIICIISQLGVADSNNGDIFLPGCSPASAGGGYNACLNSPAYWEPFTLLNSYNAGYVYKYPTPADGSGILDYINSWQIAQTYAQQNQDQTGSPITPQINVFDPNSFLNSTNNIQSRVTTDLNDGLQAALDILTNPINNFPGNNLTKLNNKTVVTCDPNTQCDPTALTCTLCCNPPTMSYPDAQTYFINNLHNMLTELLEFQASSTVMENFYGNLFTPLTASQIPDLAMIDTASVTKVDPTNIINNLPIPLMVQKVVTNVPDATVIQNAQRAYVTYSLLKEIAQTPFTDTTGTITSSADEAFYCDPQSLLNLYLQVATACDVAAADQVPYIEFTSAVVSSALFIAILGVAASVAGSALALSMFGSIASTSSVLISFYGAATLIPMFLSLSPGASTWFKTLPKWLQDAWSPNLTKGIEDNIAKLENQLGCELAEYIADFKHTTTTCR